MSVGSERDYKKGPKNNWRRTVWNEIIARRQTTGPILYLAGPQDLDRHIATSKGVDPQDMIAIDRSSKNVQKVKNGRYPAIDADLFNVLRSWPSHRLVSVVLADLCCGFEWESCFDIMAAMSRRCFNRSVVMVNLMRGRDASSNAFRELLPEAVTRFISNEFRIVNPIGDQFKNRSIQLIAAEAMRMASSAVNHNGLSASRFGDIACRATQKMRPVFFSYTSGSLVFDSVVFQPVHELAEFGLEIAPEDADLSVGTDAATSRRLSALLAVRTMRSGTAKSLPRTVPNGSERFPGTVPNG